MFYVLEENGYLSNELVEKMVQAVGFRNLIAHEYAKIEIKQGFQIAQEDINDLNEYIKTIFDKLDLGDLNPES